MGRRATSTVGGNSVAIGASAEATGANSIAIGNRAKATATGANAAGLNTIAANQYAHVEGRGDTGATQTVDDVTYTGSGAYGKYSHAEGSFTWSIGEDSHAEGTGAVAIGASSHAEGMGAQASGSAAHAEGGGIASGADSHAEGVATASGNYSHAENGGTASGYYSHAEGLNTIANHASQHVFGTYNVEDPSTKAANLKGTYVEIVGKGTGPNARSNARTLDWSGNEVLAGKLTVGAGPTANMDVATKQYVDNATANINVSNKADKANTVLTTTLSRGRKANTTVGTASFAFGNDVTASGQYAHAEGDNTTASGEFSHAEGNSTVASNIGDHAEGMNTIASGGQSHAEGTFTTASGDSAHAEGSDTIASDVAAHAEGQQTTASGTNSHAEGAGTVASGSESHAEGSYTTASGTGAHVEGTGTIANHAYQHVFGTWNEADGNSNPAYEKGKYIEIVGNGRSASNRTNARTLDWNGNETIYGDITIYGSIDCGRMTGSAAGMRSVTFGQNATALGNYSQSFGSETVASATGAFAQGDRAQADGDYSHAEGIETTSNGAGSHAEGKGTMAYCAYQHVLGTYNIWDVPDGTSTGKGYYIEIVGNGLDDQTKSNARTLDWSGNERLAGKLTVGAAPTNNMDVTTKQYVDTHIASAGAVLINFGQMAAGTYTDTVFTAEGIDSSYKAISVELGDATAVSTPILAQTGTNTIQITATFTSATTFKVILIKYTKTIIAQSGSAAAETDDNPSGGITETAGTESGGESGTEVAEEAVP